MQRPEVPGLRGLLASLRALPSSAGGRHLYRMLRQRGRAAVPVKIRYKQGRAPTHPVATTEYRRAAHLGTPPRRADAVRLRRGRARGGVEQLRNGVPRRLQRARKGAVLAAGGASRAPRLCARRRMRGRGGWAWGRASGRAVPHGAVCSRVSPPSSVVQVHVCSALCRARGVETVAAAGSWVGSWASTRVYSWSRSLYCAVSDTVLAPRSGGRGHRRACAPEPPAPHDTPLPSVLQHGVF